MVLMIYFVTEFIVSVHVNDLQLKTSSMSNPSEDLILPSSGQLKRVAEGI
jgi:hypothetical protein